MTRVNYIDMEIEQTNLTEEKTTNTIGDRNISNIISKKVVVFFSLAVSLIAICVPTTIVSHRKIFGTHVANSFYTNCINPPAGMNSRTMQDLAADGKVNWCNIQAIADLEVQFFL